MSANVGQSFLQRIDWILILLVAGIATIGLMNLYSSSLALGQSLHMVQGLWLGIGGGIAAVVATIDYRHYQRFAYVAYAFVVLLLVAVQLVGTTINNATRWLNLGVTLVQPSELMKLGIILTTAKYLADQPPRDGYSLKELLVPFGLLAIPVVLIQMQPDLGTSLVVVFICMTIILFEGLKLRTFIGLALTAAVSAPLGWMFIMKDYQKRRVLSFLDLEKDPYGPGWQVRQALIALGSGGVFGKGHLEGTQVQKGFVPYHESDFAPASWGEEHGFVGMLILMGLYVGLIWWALRIARHSRDHFGMLCATGIAALFFWHVVVNLGMVMGMLPVVGLTLPLVSYGGSSVLTFMTAVGLLMSVSLRRHTR